LVGAPEICNRTDKKNFFLLFYHYLLWVHHSDGA
jgi:hypothetical protein